MAAKRRRKSENPEEATCPTSISLSASVREQMKAHAEAKGLTLSHLMEKICKAYLQQKGRLTSS